MAPTEPIVRHRPLPYVLNAPLPPLLFLFLIDLSTGQLWVFGFLCWCGGVFFFFWCGGGFGGLGFWVFFFLFFFFFFSVFGLFFFGFFFCLWLFFFVFFFVWVLLS